MRDDGIDSLLKAVQEGNADAMEHAIRLLNSRGQQASQVWAMVQAADRRAKLRTPNPLTAREQEVLCAMAEGASNGEIAQALTLSAGTIKTYVCRIFAKTGTQNRTHAVVTGIGNGWIHVFQDDGNTICKNATESRQT